MSAKPGPPQENVIDNGNGTFGYDPNSLFEYLAVGESATDSFTYTVTDGNGGTDTGTVTITIDGRNDVPTANNDGGVAFSTNEDTGFTTGNVLTNDTDPDTNDVLSVQSIDTTGTLGTVVDNGDGTFNYDPNGAFENLAVGESATDAFTYTMNDGNGGTSVAIATITIDGRNDNPTANNDGGAAFTTNEDTNFTTGNVLSNDTDPDTSDSLSVQSIDTTGTFGTVIDNGDGTFSYDPNGAFEYLAAGESATDTYTYTVNDGSGGTDTMTVTITIDGRNDVPTASDDNFSVDNDQSLTVLAQGAMLNDGDIDSDPLTAVLVSGPANGTLTLNPNGSFTYTPNQIFSGSDTFTYLVNDGLANSTTATVTITVNAVVGSNPDPTPDDDPPSDDDPPNENDPPEDETEDPEPDAETKSPDSTQDHPTTDRPRGDGNDRDRLFATVIRNALAPTITLIDADALQGSELQPTFLLPRVSTSVETGLLPAARTAFIGGSAVFDTELLWDRLDSLREEIQSDSYFQELIVGSATALGTGLSIGYVLWTLRGSYLIASLMSSIPAWSLIDPLPILDSLETSDGQRKRTKDDNDLSLDAMLGGV